MQWKTFALVVPFVVLAACDADTMPTAPATDLAPQLSQNQQNQRSRRHGALGVVYVSSQGLYFDTFVSAEALPPHGPFQLLENGVTEFGPGDQGYVGGRWWIDNNGDGIQDEGDTYLLCPLLGPGRTEP